jgi:hypothetical protein
VAKIYSISSYRPRLSSDPKPNRLSANQVERLTLDQEFEYFVAAHADEAWAQVYLNGMTEDAHFGAPAREPACARCSRAESKAGFVGNIDIRG